MTALGQRGACARHVRNALQCVQNARTNPDRIERRLNLARAQRMVDMARNGSGIADWLARSQLGAASFNLSVAMGCNDISGKDAGEHMRAADRLVRIALGRLAGRRGASAPPQASRPTPSMDGDAILRRGGDSR